MVQTRSQSKKTLSGEIIKLLFDYNVNGCNTTQEYTKDEIYDITGGALLNVVYKTPNTILVKYLSYDHHNEPIKTSLIHAGNIIYTEDDYSTTKYGYKSSLVIEIISKL